MAEEFSNKDRELVRSSASSVNGHEFISLLETEFDDFGIGLELESYIRTDNKEAFVSLLKAREYDFSWGYDHFEIRLLKLLCFRRAVGCATAFLNGDTLLRKVDLNLGLPADPLEDEVGDNPKPLELVVKMLCYGLTALFIEHGADATSGDVQFLPLNLALDSLCDHKIVKDFGAGESVYNLFSLFRLQELKEALDTIKLLASKSKKQQVTALGVSCVEEWNLVKLATLLIVAWDKLVIDDDVYSSPIAKLIVLQHDLESDLEKKEVMRSMLHVFRLVEMSRSYLDQNRTLNHTLLKLEDAYNELMEVELHGKGTDMISANLARLAAQLLRRNKEFFETVLAEKNCSSTPSTRNVKISADIHRKLQPSRCRPLDRLGDKVLLETRLMKKVSSESMITKCIYFLPKTSGSYGGETCGEGTLLYRHLNHVMFLDDRYEFVKVVNGVESFDSLDCDYDLPTIVRHLMFLHDSADCAAAVLAGETDAFLSFRDLTDVGWSFLHNAAKLANPKLTALFLENGFLADDRRDCDELKIKAALPLNVALESFRDDFYIRRWMKNKSASDLVVLLCRDEFRHILETIRLLVLKTTDVYSDFLLYLKQGKMVELCALLMVAHKELLASDFMVDTLVPTSITHKDGGAGHGNSHEHNDPLEREETVLLLAIFEKIGGHLSAYIRLEQRKSQYEIDCEVAWLIVRAGISDALVSKIANAMFRVYFADHERVSGRVYDKSLEQHCRPKLRTGSRYPKQAAMSMSRTRGISSSMVFAPALHSRYPKQAAMSMSLTRGISSSTVFSPALHIIVPETNADFAPLVSAKRLVGVLRRRHSPMRCISIVAALTSAFRCM
ncbi:uncharacterized protein LOC141638378 isoform X3 [Silene latifolia]|uniref:uncharacterized protein LOC141638378 isoform X3 n=1 Tax=Silene latifolia TaxID=37657 RepID=UPI003D77C1D5